MASASLLRAPSSVAARLDASDGLTPSSSMAATADSKSAPVAFLASAPPSPNRRVVHVYFTYSCLFVHRVPGTQLRLFIRALE